jgi:DNA modification methylase
MPRGAWFLAEQPGVVNTIICDDAFAALRRLPDESVHLAITSPPYWNMVDYGVAGQIGHTTYERYIADLLAVWRETQRVLVPNGKLCINTPIMPVPKRVDGSTHTRQLKNINHDIECSILYGWPVCGRDGRPAGGGAETLDTASRRQGQAGFSAREDGGPGPRAEAGAEFHPPNPPLSRGGDGRCPLAGASGSVASLAGASGSREGLPPCGLTRYSLFIWQKQTTEKMFGSYPYPPNIYEDNTIEFINVFVKPGRPRKLSRAIKEASRLTQKQWLNLTMQVWPIYPADVSRGRGHPAPFPPALPQRLIAMYTFRAVPEEGFDGDIVLDMFNGTGSTCAVAKAMGRQYIGVDVNPEYCEAARRRIEAAGEFDPASMMLERVRMTRKATKRRSDEATKRRSDEAT